MRIKPFLSALLWASWGLTCAASAAPLTDAVTAASWAKDAVETLAAKGLINGYGDATFKGDRALTRWELAAVVARLLALNEQQQLSLATKEELEAVQRLAENLRPELQALGVRVSALEAKVQQLDTRVSELERITFYGSISTVVGGQCFYDCSPDGVGTGLLEYDHMVGTAAGAGGTIKSGPAAGMSMNPFIFGTMTVTDWSSGRALTNGATFTSTMRLGTNIRISDEFKAGAEFAAYASAGDSVVDAYWGVAAPYSCNPFTSVSADTTGTGANNKPYTRLCLDHFWLEHAPSHTKLTLGAFPDTNFDSFIYVSQVNPNANGSKYLGNNGFKLNGRVDFSDQENGNKLIWELMGTRLADGNTNSLVDSSYFTHSEGGNLTYLFDEERGRLRGNYLHTANNSNNGALAASGLYQAANMTLNWVNPAGYYISQLGTSDYAGVGSSTDTRPIPMVGAAGNDGITGVAGVPNLGGIGPQDQHSYGLSGRYQFDVECKPEIYAEYAHSNYRPNQRSAYSVGGNLWRVGAKAAFGKDRFKQDVVSLDLGYKSVDPTYDPFILPLPQVGGISSVLWRPEGFTYINSLYSLQDTDTYIHNRQGIDAALEWKFLPTGSIKLGYGNYNQVKTSLQDVRYSAGSLGTATPNTDVLGFSPGFIDSVFHGFSKYTFTSDGTNAYGTALENPRGSVEKWNASIGYKFLLDPGKSKRGVTIGGGGRDAHFKRDSHLSQLLAGADGLRGESQNRVDLHTGGWKVFVNYEPSDDLALDFSFTNAFIVGHLDPLGILNNQAALTGDTNAKLVDLHQLIPQIKVDYDINSAWSVGLTGRYYWTTDRMGTAHTVNAQLPAMNIDYGSYSAGHPARWQGWQVLTSCNFKF